MPKKVNGYGAKSVTGYDRITRIIRAPAPAKPHVYLGEVELSALNYYIHHSDPAVKIIVSYSYILVSNRIKK
ncbi:MAG: hypothetical protein LBQ31_10350 [Bacteroidales bacterium]|nr:hypothetical protein [Bacteroidales bacterium]